RRLLDGVAVAGLAEGDQRAPAEQVGDGQALRPVDLGAVVDAAGARPAILGDADPLALIFNDADAVVLAPRPSLVDVRAELRVDRERARASEDPAGELDRMAAHVHQHAAPGEIGVPEPVGVWTVVTFGLLHQVHPPQRALVRELLRPDVLWREAQLLGVHQLD